MRRTLVLVRRRPRQVRHVLARPVPVRPKHLLAARIPPTQREPVEQVVMLFVVPIIEISEQAQLAESRASPAQLVRPLPLLGVSTFRLVQRRRPEATVSIPAPLVQHGKYVRT